MQPNESPSVGRPNVVEREAAGGSGEAFLPSQAIQSPGRSGPASLRAHGRAMLCLLFDTRARGTGSRPQRVKRRTVGMGVRAQRALQ